LWKVTSNLEELRKNSQKCWVTGKRLAIDQHKIGFRECMGLHSISVTRGRVIDINVIQSVMMDVLSPFTSEMELHPSCRKCMTM